MTLAIRPDTPAWHEARRALITATDTAVLLGISPFKCEADLADEKLGLAPESPASLRMKVGKALEQLIADEYSEQTGRKVEPFPGLVTHPDIPWAGATPDFMAEGRLVETKSSQAKWDEIPQYVEAQVAWQLGVTGLPVADVAVLVRGSDVAVFEVKADPVLFANLVTVAEDFRRRLERGGPFARSIDRIKRDHPTDDGTELEADDDLSEAVTDLLVTRAGIRSLTERQEALEAAIKDRMGDASFLRGDGWRISWKRTRDSETTDWKSLATGLLTTLPEPERTALVGIHTTVRAGFRPFRVTEGDAP